MKDQKNYHIKRLPGIEKCRNIFKAAAMLDAILMPDWEYRYYSFNSKWDTNEQMGSMRDGEGDHYFALFSHNGLMIKGCDKEFEVNHENNIEEIISGVPDTFRGFLSEPAFVLDEATFLIWNQYENEHWLGSKDYKEEHLELLQILIGGAEYYHSWASEYYEVDIDLALVKRVFALEPIDNSLLKLLNNELEIADIEDDLEEIGYPYIKRA
ncbi:hypothetical protein DCC85_09460 [Paenibacillus sp. CAA11]|uniref:hypothetical protein n=1 Tax=Paenibacillus sp. CAA11 TaxID=1532905 RepID=UPI000D36C852|nr:hypothetical protein [Paenibacillus sp. CAA11]AWB44433.1 hypothetical protein DCC85_09460 [Paenibacillus sp. CAA11]